MMKLYSGITCPFSHRCRIVLFEKGMEFDIQDVDVYNKPEGLRQLNPYNQVPVLVDRDLVLFESNIINEYIDERFPHPQLMPAEPAMRAQGRLILFRLERELFRYVRVLESAEHGADARAAENKKYAVERITKALLSYAPVFKSRKFVLGEEFSLGDVVFATLLWRLQHYKINLDKTKEAAPILKYGESLFQRESFIQSLTASEKAMRN